MDYETWHLVLGGAYKNYEITNYEKRLIFKSSWPKSKWLKKAKKDHSVELVISQLYLSDAQRIWVRNKKTKKLLQSMGFKHVTVRRLILED